MIILKDINVEKSDLALFSFIIVTIIILFVWLKITDLFFVGYGVTTGLDIYLKFKQSWDAGLGYLKTLDYYPPLYPLAIAFTHFILRPSRFNPYILNSCLVFLLYFLTRRRFKGYKIFIFILLTTPGFYNFFRFPTMEYALLTCIFIIVYLLTSSDLWSLKKLITVGIFVGLGFLIKWTFLAYTFGLFIGYFVYEGVRRKIGVRYFLLASFLVIFFSILIAGFWYFRVLDVEYFIKSTQNDPSSLNLGGRFLFYIKNLRIVSGDLYFWLFFVGFFISLWEKKWSVILLNVIPLIVGIGILAMFPHVEIRYLFPFVVYISLLQAEVIIAICHHKRVIRFIVFSIYLVSGILNMYSSFLSIPNFGGMPEKLKVSDYKIFSEKPSWFQIFMEEKKELGRESLIIATAPFNNCSNPNACCENIRYLLKLYRARRKGLGIDIIGFDSLEFKVFPYRIKDIDLLIVTRDVIYGDEQKFARWREWVRRFNAPFEVKYRELFIEDPSYRNLILSNFKFVRKLDFISGDDILLFVRKDLVEQK